MTARYAVFAALATAMLSAPASAPAAAIEVDQGCYVEKVSAIMVTGSGYTPNSTASVTLAGTTAGVSTDETGAFTASLKAPTTSLELPGVEPMTLTGTDDTTGAAATTAVNISKIGVDAIPRNSKPHKRITWVFAGFPGIKAIYGHWRIRGKTRANHRMGVPQGPCGVLRVKARQIEADRIRYGTWTVQFDFNRRYDKDAAPQVAVRVKVRHRVS